MPWKVKEGAAFMQKCKTFFLFGELMWIKQKEHKHASAEEECQTGDALHRGLSATPSLCVFLSGFNVCTVWADWSPLLWAAPLLFSHVFLFEMQTFPHSHCCYVDCMKPVWNICLSQPPPPPLFPRGGLPHSPLPIHTHTHTHLGT